MNGQSRWASGRDLGAGGERGGLGGEDPLAGALAVLGGGGGAPQRAAPARELGVRGRHRQRQRVQLLAQPARERTSSPTRSSSARSATSTWLGMRTAAARALVVARVVASAATAAAAGAQRGGDGLAGLREPQVAARSPWRDALEQVAVELGGHARAPWTRAAAGGTKLGGGARARSRRWLLAAARLGGARAQQPLAQRAARADGVLLIEHPLHVAGLAAEELHARKAEVLLEGNLGPRCVLGPEVAAFAIRRRASSASSSFRCSALSICGAAAVGAGVGAEQVDGRARRGRRPWARAAFGGACVGLRRARGGAPGPRTLGGRSASRMCEYSAQECNSGAFLPKWRTSGEPILQTHQPTDSV